MHKSTDKCPRNDELTFNQYPKLENDLDIDVLIIGGNLTGALSTYIFNEKNIRVALISRGKINFMSELLYNQVYDIDCDLNTIATVLNTNEIVNIFPFVLDALYKLDEITDELDDKCEFIRRPKICTGREHALEKDFPISLNSISYKSGAEINQDKLKRELFHDFTKKHLSIYEETEVDEININEEGVVVMANHKNRIKCKKVLIADSYESILFFDKPYKVKNEIHSFPLVSYKYQIQNTKEVLYHFDETYLDVESGLPYINDTDEYPNIYFNVDIDRNGVLFALMGAMYLSERFLEPVQL